MTDPNRIYESTFAKVLTEDSRQLVMEVYKKQKAGQKIDKTNKDEYIHQVLHSFTELQSIVENLNMAEIFLNSYSVSAKWRKEYDYNHYFTYHYEMWIMNAIRLYERLLILTNSVYWLEIPHNEISYRVIAAHPKLENTATLLVLNKIHAALSQLQGLKNSVFHRYIYEDEELSEITRYNYLARHSDSDEKEEFGQLGRIQMKLSYLPKKKKEIEENNERLLLAVDGLLDTFDEQYTFHRDSLNISQ